MANKTFTSIASCTTMGLLCYALLLSGCAAWPRDRTMVKKETAEAAAALGLTSSDLLLAVDSSIDMGNWVYLEYYITTTMQITSVEAMVKPVGYGHLISAGGFTEFERLSQGRLKSVGPNPNKVGEFGIGAMWLKSRGQGSWTSVSVYILDSQPELYEYDGKPFTGTLFVLLASYQ